MSAVILGVDPGPTTGMCLLPEPGTGTPLAEQEPLAGQGPLAFQCNAEAARGLFEYLAGHGGARASLVAAGELFVTGRGPGARGHNAAVTRQVIAELSAIPGIRWTWRSASEVKPWADKRLAAAGLLRHCHGMPHARDAMMHALFCGVHDLGWPDPLSREGKSSGGSRDLPAPSGAAAHARARTSTPTGDHHERS